MTPESGSWLTSPGQSRARDVEARIVWSFVPEDCVMALYNVKRILDIRTMRCTLPRTYLWSP